MPRYQKSPKIPVERNSRIPRFYRNRKDWIIRLAVGIGTGESNSIDIANATFEDIAEATELLYRIGFRKP